MIENHEQYQAFVEGLAKAGVKLGERSETMAKQAIVAPGPMTHDGRAFYFGLSDDILGVTDLGDGPTFGERLYPKDVLTNDDRYPYPQGFGDGESIEPIAVDSLARDIEAAMRKLVDVEL